VQRERPPKNLAAIARWLGGGRAELSDGTRCWDVENRYPSITAAYCRDVCKTRCKECPAPRLLPEAQPGYVAFQYCATQWRHAGMAGVRTGLDYTACIARIERALPRWLESGGEVFAPHTVDSLMDDLQIMERATLQADADRRDREAAEADTVASKKQQVIGGG